jgi:hypothetical protein
MTDTPNRTETIQFKVYPAQHNAIQQAAQRTGVDMSKFLRECVRFYCVQHSYPFPTYVDIMREAFGVEVGEKERE